MEFLEVFFLLLVLLSLFVFGASLGILNAYRLLIDRNDQALKIFTFVQMALLLNFVLDMLGILLLQVQDYWQAPENVAQAVFFSLSLLCKILLLRYTVFFWVFSFQPLGKAEKRIINIGISLVFCAAFFFQLPIPAWPRFPVRTIVSVLILAVAFVAMFSWIRAKQNPFQNLLSQSRKHYPGQGLLLVLLYLTELLTPLGIPLLWNKGIIAVLWSLFFCWVGYSTAQTGLKLFRQAKTEPAQREKEQNELRTFAELHDLTPRELEVCSLLYQGLVLKEVGDKLGISVNTARNHSANLFRKTQVSTRLGLLNIIRQTS